mmetsp:Transcript_31265/g.52753  ORF Transcript_31265/g.52753 Transcript_31265/m.52753 type:complete len:216 (-) Transcript_31265:78-725(-)
MSQSFPSSSFAFLWLPVLRLPSLAKTTPAEDSFLSADSINGTTVILADVRWLDTIIGGIIGIPCFFDDDFRKLPSFSLRFRLSGLISLLVDFIEEISRLALTFSASLSSSINFALFLRVGSGIVSFSTMSCRLLVDIVEPRFNKFSGIFSWGKTFNLLSVREFRRGVFTRTGVKVWTAGGVSSSRASGTEFSGSPLMCAPLVSILEIEKKLQCSS